MRKLAPAFLLSSIVALSCGSAFAFGDMNKNKNAPSTAVKPDVTAPADSRTNGAATPADLGRAGVSGNAPTPPAVSGGMPMSNDAMATDHSKKWSARDCQGIAMTDPMYKSHNCGAIMSGQDPSRTPGATGAMTGGPGGPRASGGSGSSQ